MSQLTLVVSKKPVQTLDDVFDGKMTAQGKPLVIKLASRTECGGETAGLMMSDIVKALRAKPMTAKELAKALGFDKHAVNSLLYKALKPKLVVKIEPESGKGAPIWRA